MIKVGLNVGKQVCPNSWKKRGLKVRHGSLGDGGAVDRNGMKPDGIEGGEQVGLEGVRPVVVDGVGPVGFGGVGSDGLDSVRRVGLMSGGWAQLVCGVAQMMISVFAQKWSVGGCR